MIDNTGKQEYARELANHKTNWIAETARNYSATFKTSLDYSLAFSYYVAWPRYQKGLIYLVDNEQEHETTNN